MSEIKSHFFQTIHVGDEGISSSLPSMQWKLEFKVTASLLYVDYCCVLFYTLCLVSVWSFICFYFSRADALAGVRKQGCKSLTRAYCMVSKGSEAHCNWLIFMTTQGCSDLICCACDHIALMRWWCLTPSAAASMTLSDFVFVIPGQTMGSLLLHAQVLWWHCALF